MKNVTAVKLSEEEWGGVDIESFTVKGFYLNRVWLSGYLDPAEPDNRPISEAGHVVNQSEAAKYDKQAYADAKAPFLCDEPADGTEAQKFLTISKYRCSKSVNLTDYQDQTVHCEKGDLVSGFMRGHIYKVGDIRFKVSDLTDTPYEGTKTVTVTVTVNPWVGVDITPEFN